MYWNNPHAMKRGTAVTFEGQQSPQPNQLVLNRQLNYPAIWNGGVISLRFQGASLVNPTAEWWSPIFDLRPDLPFESQSDQSSVPVYRSETGDYGSLWVSFSGMRTNLDADGPITVGMQVGAQQAASPIDPSRIGIIDDPVNVTANFTGDDNPEVGDPLDTALFKFSPATDVDPVRYWQVRFSFRWRRTFAAGSILPIQVQSAFY